MADAELERWVAVMCGRSPQPSSDYLVIAFPDEDVRARYIEVAVHREEAEIRAILRQFLGVSRNIPMLDELHLQSLKARVRSERPGLKPEYLSEYDRRALLHALGKSEVPAWEGLTWVIDLLPHFPQQAMDAVRAYTLAHAQVLPDLRHNSLSDAVDLIRARYIVRGPVDVERLVQVLLSLHSRDFEFLVACLYRRQGFDVEVTPAQKDGGKDIIARRSGEVIFIECKNWRGRVDSDVVAGLTGRVEMHRVTRGIVIGSSGFTQGLASATEVAAQSPARILLIDGAQLVTLLNAHLGSKWPLHIERLIRAERANQAARSV